MPTSGPRPSTAIPTSPATRPSTALPTSGIHIQRRCRLLGLGLQRRCLLLVLGLQRRCRLSWVSAFNGSCLLRSRPSTALPTSGLGLQRHCLLRDSAFNGDANFWYSASTASRLRGLGLQRLMPTSRVSTFNGRCQLQGFGFQRLCLLRFTRPITTADAGLQCRRTFNGTADFRSRPSTALPTSRKNTFNKEAKFNDVVFKGNTSFNSSQFKGDALFENTTFQSKLSLTETRYNKLFIRWHNITGGLVYDDAAYMSLMKNFKDMGYFEDYDSCYFQYRKEHRAQTLASCKLIGKKLSGRP